jgi:hypothetical protein
MDVPFPDLDTLESTAEVSIWTRKEKSDTNALFVRHSRIEFAVYAFNLRRLAHFGHKLA